MSHPDYDSDEYREKNDSGSNSSDVESDGDGDAGGVFEKPQTRNSKRASPDPPKASGRANSNKLLWQSDLPHVGLGLCAAKTTTNRRCLRKALPDAFYCHTHKDQPPPNAKGDHSDGNDGGGGDAVDATTTTRKNRHHLRKRKAKHMSKSKKAQRTEKPPKKKRRARHRNRPGLVRSRLERYPMLCKVTPQEYYDALVVEKITLEEMYYRFGMQQLTSSKKKLMAFLERHVLSDADPSPTMDGWLTRNQIEEIRKVLFQSGAHAARGPSGNNQLSRTEKNASRHLLRQDQERLASSMVRAAQQCQNWLDPEVLPKLGSYATWLTMRQFCDNWIDLLDNPDLNQYLKQPIPYSRIMFKGMVEGMAWLLDASCPVSAIPWSKPQTKAKPTMTEATPDDYDDDDDDDTTTTTTSTTAVPSPSKSSNCVAKGTAPVKPVRNNQPKRTEWRSLPPPVSFYYFQDEETQELLHEASKQQDDQQEREKHADDTESDSDGGGDYDDATMQNIKGVDIVPNRFRFLPPVRRLSDLPPGPPLTTKAQRDLAERAKRAFARVWDVEIDC